MKDVPRSMLIYQADTARKCGDCQLCCKLVPVADNLVGLHKPANTRCPYQRHHKGCTIYERKPSACAHYSCRWLLGVDTADMPRPDRAHYVIDPIPDFVRVVDRVTGELQQNIEVVQVWIDPDYPDAYRDPALRRYLLRRGEEGTAAIIRFGSKDGFPLVPPNMNESREWVEVRDGMLGPQHSFDDYLAAADENARLAAKRKAPA